MFTQRLSDSVDRYSDRVEKEGVYSAHKVPNRCPLRRLCIPVTAANSPPSRSSFAILIELMPERSAYSSSVHEGTVTLTPRSSSTLVAAQARAIPELESTGISNSSSPVLCDRA